MKDLPWNKDVGNILIFAKQRQVEQNFDWFGISRHDNQLGNTPVQCFGGFVGTLLRLLVVGSLLDQFQ